VDNRDAVHDDDDVNEREHVFVPDDACVGLHVAESDLEVETVNDRWWEVE
jgi:hypothetical protein